jgi:hypothetical protein
MFVLWVSMLMPVEEIVENMDWDFEALLLVEEHWIILWNFHKR